MNAERSSKSMRISADESARPLCDPVSIVDLFTIGIGPSSSHTVGPMRAARRFAESLLSDGLRPLQLTCDLYGSLSLTGRGHATDVAVMLGLAGHAPETVDPDAIEGILHRIRLSGAIPAMGGAIPFHEERDLRWHRTFLPRHPNAMTFTALCESGVSVASTFYSTGGGAIALDGAPAALGDRALPYPYGSAADLLQRGADAVLTIANLARENEAAWRAPAETEAFVDSVLAAMSTCIDRGMRGGGELPGGLRVRRRARSMHKRLTDGGLASDPARVFQWVSLWALAVNEENAAGGRVVTAPTNGAAGVLPAVIRYYETFVEGATVDGARDLLLTASVIGSLYKRNASISAAEMGCQGEVGVACSMAAGGLCAALGGSNRQIEDAAEIGMEHNLGLTCDPIGGLVQIPCIERNTMGAIKAINAAYLALNGNGGHIVSLDQVIETMRQTGLDMRSQYKETSLGGLAVNVVNC